MLRIVDLFCGTGGISFGLTEADSRFQLAAGVDLDPAAAKTAQANHPAAEVVCAPIEQVDVRALGDMEAAGPIDLVVGGPPCQGFSSLRPSRGTALDDPRNRLYREFQRVVEDLRPRVFMLENVVGLVNATKGTLLEDLLLGFSELGYATEWRILNAASFGVPQKRERFFLLGVHESLPVSPAALFPAPTHYFEGRTIGIRDRERLHLAGPNAIPAVSAWDAISDLPALKSGQASERYSSPPRNDYQRQMRSQREGSAARVTWHVAAQHNQKMLQVMKLAGSSKSALPEGLVSSGYSSCYSRISADEVAPTITVKFTSPASSKCIHPRDDRAITPREAARLQSFPDHFIFEGSKTEVASQIGNAVPPLLAAAFAPLLADALSGSAATEIAS